MDKRLMAEARIVRGAFLLTIGLSVFISLLIIGQALLLSRVINDVFLKGAGLGDVSTPLALLVGIVLLRALLAAGRTAAAAHVAIHIKADLRERLIGKILDLGPAFTQRERSGELILTVGEGIEALDAFFRDYLPATLVAVLVPVVILFFVLPLDGLTFAVLLVTAPLIPLFMVLIGMAAGVLARQQYGVMSRMSAHFLDVMQGLPTLKLFNRSRQQIQTIQQITDRFRETTMRVLRLAFLSAFVLEFLATLSVAIVAVQIGLRLLYGNIAFVDALFLLIIAPEFYLPLRELGAKFHAGRDGAAAADRIFAVLETAAAGQEEGTQPPPLSREPITVHLKDIHLSYEDRPALRGVSLALRPGETVAIVGASGSGKTTVASLLLCFIQPDAGQVDINGMDLSEIDPQLWRERIAWVPQRPYLFNTSAADNIRIGKPDASDEEVIAAAKAAQAHDFILALEEGYDTLLGERGTRLSGGQAQRIALARAFLRDAPLMIFDEATASLDAQTESQITDYLRGFCRDRTVLVIAHRLNTIVEADYLYVLDQGRVVQQGKPGVLAAQDGPYRELLLAFTGGQHETA